MADHSPDKPANSDQTAQKLPHPPKSNAAENRHESMVVEVKQDLDNRNSSVILFSVATVNLILLGPTHLSANNLPESETITTVIQSNSHGQLTLSEPLLLSGLYSTNSRPGTTFDVGDTIETEKAKRSEVEFGVVVRTGEVTVQASAPSHCKIAGNVDQLDGISLKPAIACAATSNQQLTQTIQISALKSLQQHRWSHTIVV